MAFTFQNKNTWNTWDKGEQKHKAQLLSITPVLSHDKPTLRNPEVIDTPSRTALSDTQKAKAKQPLSFMKKNCYLNV